MGDGDGVLYRATGERVVGIDTETLEFTVDMHATEPGDDAVWGVAVDFDGFVWAVPREGSQAYRLDPESPSNPVSLTATGLIGAYTYSDMTGFSLYSVQPR